VDAGEADAQAEAAPQADGKTPVLGRRISLQRLLFSFNCYDVLFADAAFVVFVTLKFSVNFSNVIESIGFFGFPLYSETSIFSGDP
jgi:hypothetical protein